MAARTPEVRLIDAPVRCFCPYRCQAGAIVVVEPDDPRYTSAPPEQYKIPPPVGFDVGAVEALAM